MFNKIYVRVKDFIKENYLWLLFYIVFINVMTYKLPFYIYTGGGIINIDKKVEINEKIKSKGSFNMCYVSEINATLPTYLLSYIFPSWDLVSKDEIVLNDQESVKDVIKRDKIYLKTSNQSAVITAYNYALRDYKINDTHNLIIYVMDEANTNLKIGDEIKYIDNKAVTEITDITNYIQDLNVGTKVTLKVNKDNQLIDKYAHVFEKNGRKLIGISFEKVYDLDTNPQVEFNFKATESGPSGGLMLSLSIYDKLVDEDITKGLKISGTGTIDEDGKVGSIGGVKYKLKGAVDAKSDVFIVPLEENYEECINLQKKYNYKIKIIGVNTFEEAVNALKNL